MRHVKLALLIGITLTIMTGVALADHAGGSPHGGYSSSTDKCLQCHDVHQAAGDYVLMRWQTVVDTCGSCHALYQGDTNAGLPDAVDDNIWTPGDETQDPSPEFGAYSFDPNYTSNDQTPGTASQLAPYKVPYDEANMHEGHRMYGYNGDNNGNEDVIPGGSQALNLLNIWSQDVGLAQYQTEGSELNYVQTYTPGSPNTAAASTKTAVRGLYCASCHSPHADFGQQLEIEAGMNPNAPDIFCPTGDCSEHANKLLSARPNHRPTRIDDDFSITSWAEDGFLWCAGCHDQRLVDHQNSIYNHPASYCLDCHGDDELNSLGYDFPHTSVNANILAEEPDGLCLKCHLEGELP